MKQWDSKFQNIGILKIKSCNNLNYVSFPDDSSIKSGNICYILGNHADSAQCICHIGNVKFEKYLSNEVFESIVIDVNVNNLRINNLRIDNPVSSMKNDYSDTLSDYDDYIKKTKNKNYCPVCVIL